MWIQIWWLFASLAISTGLAHRDNKGMGQGFTVSKGLVYTNLGSAYVNSDKVTVIRKLDTVPISVVMDKTDRMLDNLGQVCETDLFPDGVEHLRPSHNSKYFMPDPDKRVSVDQAPDFCAAHHASLPEARTIFDRANLTTLMHINNIKEIVAGFYYSVSSRQIQYISDHLAAKNNPFEELCSAWPQPQKWEVVHQNPGDHFYGYTLTYQLAGSQLSPCVYPPTKTKFPVICQRQVGTHEPKKAKSKSFFKATFQYQCRSQYDTAKERQRHLKSKLNSVLPHKDTVQTEWASRTFGHNTMSQNTRSKRNTATKAAAAIAATALGASAIQNFNQEQHAPFSFVGTISKSIFGTATTQDVQELAQYIKIIQHTENSTLQAFKTITVNQKNLYGTVTGINDRLHRFENKVNANTKLTILHNAASSYRQGINEAQTTVANTIDTIELIRTNVANGETSPLAFSAQELNKFATEMERTHGISLTRKLDRTTCDLITDNQALYLVIDVPMDEPGKLYDFMKIDGIPLFKNGTMMVPQLDFNFLAIARKTSSYIITNQLETALCLSQPN